MKRMVCGLIVTFIVNTAFGFTSLLGPTFYNGGSFAVDVYVSTETEESIYLLKGFPSRRFFGTPPPAAE